MNMLSGAEGGGVIVPLVMLDETNHLVLFGSSDKSSMMSERFRGGLC
jgi:hypothetical protein